MEEEKKEILQWVRKTLAKLKEQNSLSMLFEYKDKGFTINIKQQKDKYMLQISVVRFKSNWHLKIEQSVKDTEILTCIEESLDDNGY